jgi:molybdate transport system substrate-binding protein
MSFRSFGRVPWPLGFALVIVLATTARAGDSEIIVASAISMREPLSTIARRFETVNPEIRVHPTFGASGAMAAQVRAGAPIDVLVVADERIIASLSKSAHVDGETRRDVAQNRLVVVAAAGFGAGITAPEDLLRPEVRRIAAPDASVPLGSYARAWLRDRNLLDALTSRIIPTPHARATLAAVDAGHVDLAIVYATDAQLAHRSRVAYEISPGQQPPITYAAVRVRDSRHPRTADDFLEYLAGDAAHAVFRAAGFMTP